jgi:hypothetical protein
MFEQIDSDSIGLPRGRTLRIEDGGGTLLHVWEGEVWVTQEGSTKDHVLIAGQTFRLDRDGVALVQSFRRSIVSLSKPAGGSVSRLHRFWMDLVGPAHAKSLSY